jgi:hypothetical protein
MPEVNIPFPGFYESFLSSMIDSEEERFLERHCEETESTYPPELRLESIDWTWRYLDHSAACDVLAREYVEVFDAIAGGLLGETRHTVDSCGMRFSIMTSPREYNFETDRLFVTVSAAFVSRMFSMSRADNHATLAATIKRRFTPRDGFIPHYASRLSYWTEKPLDDWDHNELGTLLIACLEMSGGLDDWDVIEPMCDSEIGYTAFDSAFDYVGFETECAEQRAVLLSEWFDLDPVAASLWRSNNLDTCAAIVAADPDLFWDVEWLTSDDCGTWYRCDKTRDFFETVEV